MSEEKEKKGLELFDNFEIRKVWHKEEWYFAVEDIVYVLTKSKDVKDYIKKMRKRDEALNKGWGKIVPPLPLKTSGGVQKVNCANTKGILRIIQSITSKRAEPLKLWLAEVGHQKLEEIQNPELAIDRTKQLYRDKGYDDNWIKGRMRSISIRNELTDEWQQRGATTNKDYAILTNEITHATFGLDTARYKAHKGLTKPSHNLKDNMTGIELALMSLAEATTTELHKSRDTYGFDGLSKDANDGGHIASDTRKKIEKETGKKVVSKENYLHLTKNRKKELDDKKKKN